MNNKVLTIYLVGNMKVQIPHVTDSDFEQVSLAMRRGLFGWFRRRRPLIFTTNGRRVVVAANAIVFADLSNGTTN